MPTENNFHLIPVASIVVGERFRKDFDGQTTNSITYLRDDIAAHGLYHPLVVTRDTLRLLVGGRRLRAIQLLNWKEVPVQFFDEVDNTTAREIELEENLARKDLTWQETARLTEEIDSLRREKHGSATAGRPTANGEAGWSLRKTAELQNVTVPIVHQNIRLANALKIIPSLMKETSRANALRAVDRLEEDIERELERRAKQVQYSEYESSVKCGDATSLILNLPNESIDCIITDPPYGVDVGHGGGHRMEADFDDSPEAAIAILRSILPELRRVLKPSGHFYLFFAPQRWATIFNLCSSCGFDVRDVPNIWTKPGGATGTTDWDNNFAPAWEPFLFASNKQRRLNFKRKNVFTYSVELGASRLHPTQKPIELIRELVQLSTQPGEIILDPFAGSGSTLVAASQLRRKFLGFELNERYVQIALQRLVNEGRERPYVAKPEP